MSRSLSVCPGCTKEWPSDWLAENEHGLCRACGENELMTIAWLMCAERHKDAVRVLKKDNDRLREMLKSVEFGTQGFCPRCGSCQRNEDGMGYLNGHKDDCPLNALLKEDEPSTTT